MEKNPKIFLEHILESIEFIEEYTAGISQAEFSESREKIDAVIRRIEIIGEASKNLPANFRATAVHIPWKQIAGWSASGPGPMRPRSRMSHSSWVFMLPRLSDQAQAWQ